MAAARQYYAERIGVSRAVAASCCIPLCRSYIATTVKDFAHNERPASMALNVVQEECVYGPPFRSAA